MNKPKDLENYKGLYVVYIGTDKAPKVLFSCKFKEEAFIASKVYETYIIKPVIEFVK